MINRITDSPILTQWIKPRLGLILTISLIILVIIALICTVFQWWIDVGLIKQTTVTPRIQSANLATESALKALPDKHLFGEANLPMSNLSYHLTGIVKADKSDPAGSKAYIATEQGSSKIYQIGDQLDDGITIDDITESAVILKNNGRLEKLPLIREKLEFKPPTYQGE